MAKSSWLRVRACHHCRRRYLPRPELVSHIRHLNDLLDRCSRSRPRRRTLAGRLWLFRPGTPDLPQRRMFQAAQLLEICTQNDYYNFGIRQMNDRQGEHVQRTGHDQHRGNDHTNRRNTAASQCTRYTDGSQEVVALLSRLAP